MTVLLIREFGPSWCASWSRGPQLSPIGTQCKHRYGSRQGKRFQQQSRRAVDERNRSNEIRLDVEIGAERPDEVCRGVVDVDQIYFFLVHQIPTVNGIRRVGRIQRLVQLK